MDNKMVLLVIIITVTLCLNSCDEPWWFADRVYSLKVENTSIDTIMVYPSFTYPDTSLVNQKPRLQTVRPNGSTFIDSKKKWEDILPMDTLSIFALSKETIDTYRWEEIRSDYKILKRYDLSIEDMKNNSWTIRFP